jgi:hypothetical protein
VAFRAWWTVQTQLDRLRADGAISQPAYDAAGALRDDVHRMGRVSGSTLARIGIQVQQGEGDRHGDMLGRLTATRRLRAIHTRLGPRAYAVANLVIVDMSWCALGCQLGVNDCTARRIAAAAMMRLVGNLGESHRCTRTEERGLDRKPNEPLSLFGNLLLRSQAASAR